MHIEMHIEMHIKHHFVSQYAIKDKGGFSPYTGSINFYRKISFLWKFCNGDEQKLFDWGW